ncbi:MAG: methyltransferase protein [Mucilaginibacter sp.]|nr:methyltransferase protein [Mucilaginibacter sp.]
MALEINSIIVLNPIICLHSLLHMNIKEHYDIHLGNFYSWMVGDFADGQQSQQEYLSNHYIIPNSTGVALDLGAGHGLQSVSLAKIGFKVYAIDFNRQLLGELRQNSMHLPVEVIEGDLRSVADYKPLNPEVIICAGDTLSHLENTEEIEQLIADCAVTLYNKGKLILSFRDYSNALTGDKRFIPVKSDAHRILTCCLDYTDNRVLVTDLLHTQTASGWQQTVSSYYKTRILPDKIVALLEQQGFNILYNEPINRMIHIIAQKQS